MSWNQFVSLNKVAPRYAIADIEKTRQSESMKELAYKFTQHPFSWIITGKPGTGKTHFTFCLIRGLVEKFGIGIARWFKAKNLDDRIITDMKKFGSADYFIQSICETPTLFIDDFGIDRDTERMQRDIYEIIDYRWEHNKPCIISTNLSPEELQKLYGSRIYSRFKDYEWSIFQGEDLRGKSLQNE